MGLTDLIASKDGFFSPKNRNRSRRHQEIYALYEIAYTVVDFAAASAFIVGSFAFFFQDWHVFATWMFLAGSILFALKPTIRLAREVQYWRMGHVDTLAERARA